MFELDVFNGFHREAGIHRGATSLSPFGIKSAAKVALSYETAKAFASVFH